MRGLPLYIRRLVGILYDDLDALVVELAHYARLYVPGIILPAVSLASYLCFRPGAEEADLNLCAACIRLL